MENENFILVAVETSSIQSYIFNSNRLKENIGASYLVALATGKWAYDCIQEVTTQHNISDTNRQIIEDQLDVEVLYSGGGNFVSLFRREQQAREFVRRLSRHVLQEAPGLSLTFLDAPFKWEDALSVAVGKLLGNLRQARSQQPLQRGVGGLGVTMMCNSSSLPANHFKQDLDNNWQVYSSEVQSKQGYSQKANKYLREQLQLDQLEFNEPTLSYEKFALSTELDELGRSKDENSFIAVVHADGNGLGLLIQGLQERFPNHEDNRPYITYMRNFAEKVKLVNQRAQHRMFQLIANSVQRNRKTQKLEIVGLNEQTITLSREKGSDKWIFPIRPLVSGGDDVTFVCDGRIGLDLAVIFLETFEDATRTILAEELNQIGLEKLTACAGVAIVKSHYPFARAYDLADELAGSAKQLVNSDAYIHDVGHIRYSAIDWHFTTGGLYDELDEMRHREYWVEDQGTLTLRPIFIQAQGHPYRNWFTLQQMTTEFQTKWRDNRSKAKGLMKALRQGDVEVEVFNLRYLDKDIPLPDIADFDTGFGWRDGICGYYDALELMDLYVPLIGQGED